MLGSYKNLSWSTRNSSGFIHINSSSVSNGGGAGLTNVGLDRASNFRPSSNFSLLSGKTLSLSKMSFLLGQADNFASFLTTCVAEKVENSFPFPFKNRHNKCDSLSLPLVTSWDNKEAKVE